MQENEEHAEQKSAGSYQQQRGDNNSEEASKRQADQELMKNSILTQIVDKSGMARLSNLRAAKPDKAQAVENMLIQMARTGRIRGKMSDDELRRLLDQFSMSTSKKTKVKYDRRKAAIDSDDEEISEKKNNESSGEDD